MKNRLERRKKRDSSWDTCTRMSVPIRTPFNSLGLMYSNQDSLSIGVAGKSYTVRGLTGITSQAT